MIWKENYYTKIVSMKRDREDGVKQLKKEWTQYMNDCMQEIGLPSLEEMRRQFNEKQGNTT